MTIRASGLVQIFRSNVVDNLIQIVLRLFENDVIKCHGVPLAFDEYAPSILSLQ